MSEFLCVLVFAILCCGNALAYKWIAPDAWGRSAFSEGAWEPAVCKPCNSQHEPSASEAERSIQDHTTSIYYGKLVKFVFNRNRMVYDDSFESYSRLIIFKITSKQLDILEQSKDPRDWDSVLAEALPKAELPNQWFKNDVIANIIASTKHHIYNIFISSEIRFTLLFLASFLMIMYLSRKYKYGLIGIALIGCFLFGFIHAYYDCNMELKIKELVNAMESNVDPCQEKRDQDGSFFNFFKRPFTKQQCIDHLINKNKIKLPFCRPGDVILKYTNDMLFEQIFIIVEKSTVVFQKSFENIPFPYNIVAMLVFGLTLPQFITLIFKYIITPTVWINRCIGSQSQDRMEDGSADRLTGENLKLFLETVKLQNQSTSGIQIIKNVQSKLSRNSPWRIEGGEDIIDAQTEVQTISNKSKEIVSKS